MVTRKQSRTPVLLFPNNGHQHLHSQPRANQERPQVMGEAIPNRTWEGDYEGGCSKSSRHRYAFSFENIDTAIILRCNIKLPNINYIRNLVATRLANHPQPKSYPQSNLQPFHLQPHGQRKRFSRRNLTLRAQYSKSQYPSNRKNQNVHQIRFPP